MKTKLKTMCALIAVMAAMACMLGSPVYAETINYGDVTYSPVFTASNYSDIWNLTAGDLTLTYSINLSGVTQTEVWDTPYVEVGIRQVGAANFNPGPFDTYQGGAGGWMTSLVGDLATNPVGQDIDDKHNLSASGGRGEGDYDATDPGTVVSPFGTFSNYGIWFDRDGVDEWQDDHWGAVDGATYNTGGLYDIAIIYHAITADVGTMFATVNGIQTGFYTAGWNNAEPDIYPAGLSFTGDMTQMQVFTGAWYTNGAGGNVMVSNITATGTRVPEPTTMLLLGFGLIGLSGFRRKFIKK